MWTAPLAFSDASLHGPAICPKAVANRPVLHPPCRRTAVNISKGLGTAGASLDGLSASTAGSDPVMQVRAWADAASTLTMSALNP